MRRRDRWCFRSCMPMMEDVAPFYVESQLRHCYADLFSDFFRLNAPKFESFAMLRNKIVISGKGYEVSLFVCHVEYVRLLEEKVKELLAKINVLPEQFVAACHSCLAAGDAPVVFLMKQLTQFQDFDSFAEMMEGVYNNQLRDMSDADGRTGSLPSSASKSKNKAVRVLWDLENVSVGKKAGFATVAALMQFLKSQDLTGSAVDCRITAFFTMGKVSKSVIVDLDKAAVELVWVATKREDADRKLGTRIMQEMSVLPPESTTIVVISSDQDFRTHLQQLTRAGFRAIVIHDAPEGQWRSALEMHASQAFLWKNVMDTFLVAETNASPSPTPSVDEDNEGVSAIGGGRGSAADAAGAGVGGSEETIAPDSVKIQVLNKKGNFVMCPLAREVLMGEMVGKVVAWHGAFGFVAVPVALLPSQVPKGKAQVSVCLLEPDRQDGKTHTVTVRVYVHYTILNSEQHPFLGKGQEVRMQVELGDRGPFASSLLLVVL